MADFLTTAQAAKRAGTSRPTISRALKSGELLGTRANDSRWLIDPADLDAWKEGRSSVHDERTMNSVHEQQKSKNFERLNAEVDALKGQISELRQVTARLEGEASANKERITDLTTERDRLLSMLEAGPVKGAGFWSRLFGRG